MSGEYISPFLDTDDLKMALWARKVSGAFEKRAPGSVPGRVHCVVFLGKTLYSHSACLSRINGYRRIVGET